jgi:hypothetical protein
VLLADSGVELGALVIAEAIVPYKILAEEEGLHPAELLALSAARPGAAVRKQQRIRNAVTRLLASIISSMSVASFLVFLRFINCSLLL